MRIAIVNAWYVASGGAEAVDNVIGTVFPNADLFTLFYREDRIPESLRPRLRKQSFLQSIPTIEKTYRLLMPLFPQAIESLDLRGYDLVISSDHGVAKGVLTDHSALHVCYCHTPWRQLYDLYWKSVEIVPPVLRPAYRMSAHYLRQWDYQAAQRPDHLIANSRYIQQRIAKHYRRNSTVIYPPVETNRGYLVDNCDDYYLCVGRVTHTKRLDLAIQACNRLKRRLIIAGEGRELRRLKALAGSTIEFAGRVDDKQLQGLYANCRALLFAADEDFGIVPVEAQSYGRPVIAFGHGGSLETVRVADPEGRCDTGVFFREQSVESLQAAIVEFEMREQEFVPAEIKASAARFDRTEFEGRFYGCITQMVREKFRTIDTKRELLVEV
jgi:glycosyltransferase involved in cell wall biosynthesis